MGELSDSEWEAFTRNLAALEADALSHFEHDRRKDGLDVLEKLLALDRDEGIAAHIAVQYAFIVGYFCEKTRYDTALSALARWDERSLAELGRSFAKPFHGNAGLAMILYAIGRSEDAREPARAALEQGLTQVGRIPGHPELGKAGPLPEELLQRLMVIADMWNEDRLGPKPDL